MKIKSIAAVGALGVGLGIAGFVGGTGTASAACGRDDSPPLPTRRVDVRDERRPVRFRDKQRPGATAIDVLLNGTDNRDTGPRGTDRPPSE